MCDLYERIKELCTIKKVSGSRMCLDLGLSKSTMSDLKTGRIKSLSLSTTQKIAAYFDVSVGYLLGEEEQKETPASEEKNLRNERVKEMEELLMKLPPEQQDFYIAMLRGAVSGQDK